MINQVLEQKILSIDKSKWKLTKLGTLAEDISVRVDKPGESEYDRFVGLDNFISGDIKIKSWASTKNLTSSAKAFKAGDILFARRNAYLRRASLVDFDGCCSGDAFVIREKLDKVVPGFLAFLMNSNALWDYANSNAAGTMSKRVKWRDLAEYEFLLPPKAEQARLAELLWAIDEVIEKQKLTFKKYKELEEVKLLNLLVGDKGTSIASDQNKIRLSDGYRYMKVNDFILQKKGAMKMGPFGSSLKKEYFVKDGVKFKVYGQENVFRQNMEEGDRYINFERFEKLKSCEIFAGDFLITVMGTIGQTMLVPSEFERGIMDSHLIRLQINESVVSPEIIGLQFKLSIILNQIKKLAVGGIMDGLSSGTINKLEFIIPPIKKQKEISNIINNLSSCALMLELSIRSSLSLQKSLINQLF
jgi:type I restriction enzyme S subunit